VHFHVTCRKVCITGMILSRPQIRFYTPKYRSWCIFRH